jgi:uncharacterized protein YjbJ (UPF0337 family)
MPLPAPRLAADTDRVEEEAPMGTRDKASNKALDLKGRAKEAVGKVTHNEDLEDEGRVDQAEAALRDAAEKAKDAVSRLKDAVTGR